MFLLNSCLSLFSATTLLKWHPFSRSYGVILPSSLTMLLPPALGFSPHLPVSVCGTGTYNTIAAFLDGSLSDFPTKFRYASRFPFAWWVFLPYRYFACPGFCPPGFGFSLRVPTVLIICSTGICTCYPSTTSFDLALGPDLPWVDQLYSGNLRYSAKRILTSFSLLIPAFSLLITPPFLPVWLLRL